MGQQLIHQKEYKHAIEYLKECVSPLGRFLLVYSYYMVNISLKLKKLSYF